MIKIRLLREFQPSYFKKKATTGRFFLLILINELV
jgi:hypothetical protein